MSKKLDRALNGPSWMEVILGACLSLALGVVLAAAYLVFKPVVQVKELPKEPVADQVYYIEGSHDSAKARRVASKQKIFLAGGSIAVVEDELNFAAMPPSAPAGKAPGSKAPAPVAAAEPAEVLTPGALNFRLHEGTLQVTVPVRVRYALVGLDATFLVQATGTFEKSGDRFVFAPSTLYVGSCPMQRLPGVSGAVVGKFLGAQRFPADLVEAWGKLADVTIDGATLKLSMPQS